MRGMLAPLCLGGLLTVGSPVSAQAAGSENQASGGALIFRVDQCNPLGDWATICQDAQLVANFRSLPDGSFLVTQVVRNTITISDSVNPLVEEGTTTTRTVFQQVLRADSEGRYFTSYRSVLDNGESSCTTTYKFNIVGGTVVLDGDVDIRCQSSV